MELVGDEALRGRGRGGVGPAHPAARSREKTEGAGTTTGYRAGAVADTVSYRSDGVDGLVAVLQDASVFPTVSLALVKTLIGPIHLNDDQKRRILQACERRLNEDEAPTRSSVVRQLRELLAPSAAVAAS